MSGQILVEERRVMDLTGQRFGRLTALSVVSADSKHVRWLCRCDCGNQSTPTANKLRGGRTVSCGCVRVERARATKTTHGMSRRHPDYKTWTNIRARCECQTDQAYPDYGARGITLCSRWRDGEGHLTGFECFIADMGPRPTRQHSIERVDNNRGYEPANCIWATKKKQARNRRSNRIVEVSGEKMAVSEACDRLGLDFNFINGRMQSGFTFERAISQPKRWW